MISTSIVPQPLPTQSPGLELGDIYYVLFRHKWKIMICSAAGIFGAFALFRSEIPPYQSEAKLLVRYIISESGGKSAGPVVDNATQKIMPDDRSQSIMTTETEILNSLDLAREVAAAIGPERILAKAGGGKELAQAAMLVRNNLSVGVIKTSSVVQIVFRHPDPELVQPVLQMVIDKYLKLHQEAHRSTGLLGDSLAEESDMLRSRLNQTEDELRKAINKAGVISLESAKEEYSTRMISTRKEIAHMEMELAGRLAVLEDIKKRRSTSASAPGSTGTEEELPSSVIDEARALSARKSKLQGAEQDALLAYKPENDRVKVIQAQLADTEAAIQKLVEKYPILTKIRPTVTQNGPDADTAEAAQAWLQITSYQAKIKEMNSQLLVLKNELAKLDLAEGAIMDLRRKKDLEEAHYKYYAANLEQTRINQMLGTGKVSNITQIQAPSPAFRVQPNQKKVMMTAAGGILVGLAWAFLIELYLDRSVRRPVDLQRLLRVPLFLSIPRLKNNQALRALSSAGSSGQHANGPALLNGAEANGTARNSAKSAPLQLFHETLRDRLIGYFESKNLTHKPKLVAVTGLSASAGVTTTAAGLARCLSETGEGNVLLVDMTVGQGAAQQFSNGKEACDLDELLEGRSQAHVRENLYVVAEGSNSDRLSRNLPQRFAKLVPKLKASDFDYIIFDMPIVNQLSITPRLAGFMDMVLLVIESEKTDREVIQGAYELLAESKAHVGVVLNKTRAYVPSRLQQQLVGS